MERSKGREADIATNQTLKRTERRAKQLGQVAGILAAEVQQLATSLDLNPFQSSILRYVSHSYKTSLRPVRPTNMKLPMYRSLNWHSTVSACRVPDAPVLCAVLRRQAHCTLTPQSDCRAAGKLTCAESRFLLWTALRDRPWQTQFLRHHQQSMAAMLVNFAVCGYMMRCCCAELCMQLRKSRWTGMCKSHE
eukprot:3721263-Pleurochrysis_carterae.AAC.4